MIILNIDVTEMVNSSNENLFLPTYEILVKFLNPADFNLSNSKKFLDQSSSRNAEMLFYHKIYRLELAENKKVNESRVIFLDSVRPSYNHAFPDPDV